jgi:hypothetical protein
MNIRLKNGSIIKPIGVPEERLRTTEERAMATERERQLARDRKLEEAVEEIKKLSNLVYELKEALSEREKGKSVKKVN